MFEKQMEQFITDTEELHKIEKMVAARDSKLLADQLRDLSMGTKSKLVLREIETDWVSTLWTSTLLTFSAISLQLGTLWIIIVISNSDLIVITIYMCIYQVSAFFGCLIASLLNDHSQFAKFFLSFGCICGIFSSALTIYASQNFSVTKDQQPAATTFKDSVVKIGLFKLQLQGLSYRTYLSLMVSVFFLGAWEGIQTQVATQYSRNAFTKKLQRNADHSQKTARNLGMITGCLSIFFILSKLSPELRWFFLTVNYSKSGQTPISLQLDEVMSQFQLCIGVFILLFSVLSLGNIVFRFQELSDFDREQFSLQQTKTKRESDHYISMLSHHTEYTFATINDLEMLKCQRPNSKHLTLLLAQKSIFSFIRGVLIASSGLCLYLAFDFITFEETLLSAQASGGRFIAVDANAGFKFEMQQKPRQVILISCLVHLASFASVGFYRVLKSLNMSNISIINYSLFLLSISLVFFCLSENYLAT